MDAQLLMSAGVAAVAATAATIGPARLLFWWSWSRKATTAVLLADFLLCLAVGALTAYAAALGGWAPTGQGFGDGIAPALLGTSAARRPGRRSRSAHDSGVFGLVRFGHDLMDGAADARIQEWSRAIPDDRLLVEAARLDAAGSGSSSSLLVRKRWRRRAAGELCADDRQTRSEARARLENAVASGIRRARRRRPS